ncbi:MAG: ATP-binding protein, partial [Candidatus Izemoplasmatales bacterium]
MKKLTKVRLINWHFFSNETIYVRNNTLVTGQNATGKSTIVDAIAFVATAGDQIFNLAANEKSKRDLRGYVKCKLGIDNHEYLREGDTTGHIALEFYDETKNEYFVVGTVIDVFGELLPPKVIFYQLNGKLTESLFVGEGGEILTTLSFKKAKNADHVYMTRREAKLAFRSAFGSINEAYFSLLPKALAFKPIPDVKEFIYHYLLEEKELDVESIKESIHSYKDLEATLKIIKVKVAELKEIKELYEEIEKNQDQKQFLEYFLDIIDLESIKQLIAVKNSSLTKIAIAKDKNKGLLDEIDKQLDLLDDRSKEIFSLLQSDNTFNAEQIYDKEILSLTKKIEEQEEIRRYLQRKVEKVKPLIEELRKEYPNKTYDDLSKLDFLGITSVNFDKVKLASIEIEKELKQILDENAKESGRLEEVKKGLITEINDIYQTLKDLENHKIRYNPMIQKLKTKIEEGLKQRFAQDISVHIVAELLEITDKSWSDTVEDYLGQQRFNLIVEPRYFDEALQTYNRIKDSLNIYGIGLINTKKIQHFTSHSPNSLASIITSENVDAMHYINMVCGNLIMVDDVADLEKHPQAITNTGMVYRSYTVRSLNRNTEKPFIGKRAGEAQLEKWRVEAINSKKKYSEITDKITKLSEENKVIQSLNLPDLLGMVESSMALDAMKTQRKSLVDKKHNLPKESLNSLREEYELVKEEIRGYNNNRRKVYEENGKLSSDEFKIHEELVTLEANIQTIELKMNYILETRPLIKDEAYALFEKEFKSVKDAKKVESDYRARIEVELSNIENLENSLKTKQFKYTAAYNLSYSYGVEHIQVYLDELNKLIKSDLVKYESKVREAREAAEKLFKEDFIAKLRNYIISAQEEIKKINATLASIHFGEDTYEFIFPKSKEYGDYYDMVLSDESMLTGSEIFNYEFEMKYERQLEELFINLASEDLGSGNSV